MKDEYDRALLVTVIQSGASTQGLLEHMPALSEAKNDAAYALAKGRAALRPYNNGVTKATEADRTIEMDAKTADLKRDYQNLADLWELGMLVVGGGRGNS